MLKYKSCKDVKELETLQDKAIASVASAKAQVQVALVATAIHIGLHGDVMVAQRFVDGLGNSVNGKAIVDWLVKYAHLNVGDEEFTGLSKGYAAAIKASLDEAKAVMWWELKPVNPFKGYSLDDALKAVITRHKSITGKLMTMPKEDAAKVDVTVNDATIRQVLALCNFDAILAPSVEDEADKLAELLAVE